jgi:biopolymer transport protein ExbD
MSINTRDARSLIRKAKKRVPEGEDISHLNIMPMLDIMTILLVFMIMQASVGATDMIPPDVTPPDSTTEAPVPEQAVTVFIGKKAMLVEGDPVVAVRDGDVDSGERAGGALGLEITKLKNTLSLHRVAFRDDPKYQKDPTALENLSIIADGDTPYRLLVSVMYSARQSCIGDEHCYRQFRLIVARPEK